MDTPKMTVPESEIRAAIERIDALKRENAELRETLKAVRAVNVNEFGGVADVAIERLIASIPGGPI